MTNIHIPDDGGDTMMAVDVGGYILPHFWHPPSLAKDIFDHLPKFECREDDIMLCTYPKTGTNWLYEIIKMVLNRSSERVKSMKTATMMEAVPHEDVDEQPSVRVLNCHCPPRYLPKDLARKQIKTILCNRNPKDTAVSYYNHMTGIKSYEYSGKWENWIRPYVQGKTEYGKYTDYLNEWQQLIEDGPGHPIHVLYYEDLKKNGIKELDKIAKFLDVKIDDQMKKDIIHMCGFDKMQQEKRHPDPNHMEEVFTKDFRFFRKGQVGDWKNWFTVAQNEMLEEAWNKDIRKDTVFKFEYT